MRDDKGFDEWAAKYDAFVDESEKSGRYPFAGYRDIQDSIFRTVTEKTRPRVLDLGFGTGRLTSRLYDAGCEICGQDYSESMLAIAREKMPDASLYCGDMSKGLVPELSGRRYDYIISTWAFHHLNPDEKRVLLNGLINLLEPGGRILIGDISFETREEYNAVREAEGEAFDTDEYYTIISELSRDFDVEYTKKSYCSGVIEISK